MQGNLLKVLFSKLNALKTLKTEPDLSKECLQQQIPMLRKCTFCELKNHYRNLYLAMMNVILPLI